MKSNIKSFLIKKAQANALNEDFYNSVGISSQRIEAIIFGHCGATIKEINNVAKYFKISSSDLVNRASTHPVITIQCEYCMGDFIPSNARAIYCSDACRNKAFRAKK